MSDWKIYRGDGVPTPDRIENLPDPPPWRIFDRLSESRAVTFLPPKGVVEVVNAALYLRRPILVTGDPGRVSPHLPMRLPESSALGMSSLGPLTHDRL